MHNLCSDKKNILFDVNCDINSFMAPPTVYRNLISDDCWKKKELIILETHNIGFISSKGNKLMLNKSFDFGLKYCLKNSLISKIEVFKFCYFKFLNKLKKRSKWLDNQITYKIYKKAIKKCGVCYIIRGTYFNDSLKALLKINKKYGVKYSLISTDPIFYQPINKPSKKLTEFESKLIKHSDKYFIPEFCIDSYKKQFNCPNNLISYCLPAAIEFKTNDLFKTEKFTFSYFGTLRKNYSLFDDYFKYLSSNKKNKLKFYGWTSNKLANRVGGQYFNPVLGPKLIDELLKSDFLMVLDNPPSMSDLIPSKTIMYASTTKPIIVFGENDDSALLKFLKKIKYERYIYIKPTDSYELLDKFIKEYSNVSFDEECYKRQSDYYPSNVSLKIYNSIFK